MHKIKYEIFLFLLLLPFISGSEGDRSPFYQNCVKSCSKANCTLDGSFQPKSAELQDIWCRWLKWNCKDDCRYHCMWRTVQGFQERGYKMPKFHGKWPFKRMLGVQEPASAFASLLNLLSHIHMYSEIRKEFQVRDTPLVLFWHVFALVCMNAWTWSIIFHTRDTPFTEFMDYACALSMVMSLFVAAIVRIFHRRRKLTALILLFTLLYYVEHVRYLYSGRIDYDFNMLINILFGVVGSLLWMVWACFQYLAGRHYVWRLVAFTVFSGAALTLELFDFPPRNGWDAHALWHLSTSSLPVLFYRFVIHDIKFLKTVNIEKSNFKIT
ncbi:unnamed protein product [Euphydryas editha]|uniref:Post-GPI attachment to proteins factor 3 n=1 Tax=Euphydryas editha TaxID=104508 RepID=A0AAU9TJA4_EUPED|nr:unnamed protein product [Euphydryas editha]